MTTDTKASTACIGSPEWERNYQRHNLVRGGLSESHAEAVTNLLQLHSMEAYEGGNGHGGTVWRVQYQRHAFKLNYCTVPGDWTSITMWVETCKEVEARYGHKP